MTLNVSIGLVHAHGTDYRAVTEYRCRSGAFPGAFCPLPLLLEPCSSQVQTGRHIFHERHANEESRIRKRTTMRRNLRESGLEDFAGTGLVSRSGEFFVRALYLFQQRWSKLKYLRFCSITWPQLPKMVSRMPLLLLALAAFAATTKADDMTIPPPSDYYPPPTYGGTPGGMLYYVSPNASVYVGVTVTFYGEDFNENCTVLINDTECAVELVSDEELTCKLCAVGELSLLCPIDEEGPTVWDTGIMVAATGKVTYPPNAPYNGNCVWNLASVSCYGFHQAPSQVHEMYLISGYDTPVSGVFPGWCFNEYTSWLSQNTTMQAICHKR
eukprot:gene15112-21168_t